MKVHIQSKAAFIGTTASAAVFTLLVAVTVPQQVAGAEVVVRSAQARIERQPVPFKAFDVCARAFVERLFPGQEVPVRSRLDVRDWAERREVAWNDMKFSMLALLRSDRTRLAVGSCTVRSDGRLKALVANIDPASRFAGLTPKDVLLTMGNR